MSMSVSEEMLIVRRNASLGSAYRLFYEKPFHPVRGEGVWLYDEQGRPFLDAYNNVPSVGHCHPHVVDAITRQARILNTHTRYLDSTILDYAEQLLSTVPKELSQLMLTCTGSEANDLALRIANAYTGGTGVIVTEFAYHGVTTALAQLSPSLGVNNRIGEHVFMVAAPDTYRTGQENIGEFFQQHVLEALERMKQKGIKPAALLVDTVFSSDGVFTEPKFFLKPAVQTIRAAGGVFIADEVQAGLGRTGDSMWGVLRHGVVPDILTMGKPMGNGHPLAGLMVKPELAEKFSQQARYFNTFGGNPVSCAAGIAVLEVVEQEKLISRAKEVGNYLKKSLYKLASKHNLIGDIRGTGLFLGVELVTDGLTKNPASAEATRIVNDLRENGVLISTSGPLGNVLKIRPPLVFSMKNVDFLCDRLEQALSRV